MLRFGMPTLIETASIEECAALCSELELDFVEMNMNLPQYQVQTMDVQRLKAAARDYGIHYTIHLDENMNMADFNPLVAGAYRQTAIETIGLAKKLEIPVLNMHMPVLYSAGQEGVPVRRVPGAVSGRHAAIPG